MQFTALNSIAYSDIDTVDIARANGLYTVMQQLSLALGVAVAAISLDFSQWLHGGTALVPTDFTTAFLVISVGAFLSIPQFLKLPRNAGASMSGHVA